DARRMLMVGTGKLARQLVRFHGALMPQLEVSIWGRTPKNVSALLEEFACDGIRAEPVQDLAQAVADADLISCATLATSPLIRGEWVRPGTHVDLVGSFTPEM